MKDEACNDMACRVPGAGDSPRVSEPHRGLPRGRKQTVPFLCFWKASPFSPAAFVLRAVIIAALFSLSNLFGLQEYTTFLSGTSANLSMSWQTASFLGLIHLLLYVSFILLVPVSLITAALIAAWTHWRQKRLFFNPATGSTTGSI